jgi:hypothetical protein
VSVFQQNVIVDLSYYEGQRVVFFASDGQLSEEFANDNNLVRKKDENGNNIGGYLDPDKRNITAVKLRGERSEGLVLPIECLSKYVDISTLKDGDQITVLNGHEICKKYIPRRNQRQNSNGDSKGKHKKKFEKETVSYPFFDEHIDTSQLNYNLHAFKEGDIIYLTRKLHGSSQRCSNAIQVIKKKRNPILKKLFGFKDKETKAYRLVTGTRRVVLSNFDKEEGYYGSNAFRKPYHDFFKDKLPKGMEIFFEVVGWVNESTPIMGRCNNKLVKDKEFEKMYGKETVFTYGCKPGQNDIYVYRMTFTNEDGVVIELPTEEVKVWCERLGCKFVPILDKFLFTTIDDLNERVNKWLDIPDEIDSRHVAEGVVVRIDNRSKFTAFKQKSFQFKVLEGIIKDTSDAPDMEESQELEVEETN